MDNKIPSLVNNILSTALHDIYNEINNLFFVSENLMENLSQEHPHLQQQFQQDFFQIIQQIKHKQFIFNNLFNNKIITLEELLKYSNGFVKITGDYSIQLPIKIFVILLLMINDDIIIANNQMILSLKKRFINELTNGNNWITDLFKQYAKEYNLQWTVNNNLTINLL